MDTLIQTLRRKKSDKRSDPFDDHGERQLTDHEELAHAQEHMREGDTFSIVLPSTMNNDRVKELDQVLTNWINEELENERIIVKDLRDDLFDGQVLQKLFETLSNKNVGFSDIRQAEKAQMQKLEAVLDNVADELKIDSHSRSKWSVQSIHSKNYVAIIHLLVALATHFRPNLRLPEYVSIPVVVLSKENNRIKQEEWEEKVTLSHEEMCESSERDAFDALLDYSPEKFNTLKTTLMQFVNQHLDKLGLSAEDMESSFSDGCFLIMLIGQLDGFFVPLHSYYMPADTDDKRLKNVDLALELVREAGCKKPKVRSNDIVQRDIKATLRLIYAIYEKFKAQAA